MLNSLRIISEELLKFLNYRNFTLQYNGLFPKKCLHCSFALNSCVTSVSFLDGLLAKHCALVDTELKSGKFLEFI